MTNYQGEGYGFEKKNYYSPLGRLFDKTMAYKSVLGARESSHNETVLSSTHNICSGED